MCSISNQRPPHVVFLPPSVAVQVLCRHPSNGRNLQAVRLGCSSRGKGHCRGYAWPCRLLRGCRLTAVQTHAPTSHEHPNTLGAFPLQSGHLAHLLHQSWRAALAPYSGASLLHCWQGGPHRPQAGPHSAPR